MALIGTIRKRGSWILVVLIALGLGGFILQDMLMGSGPSSNFGGQPSFGKVNGQKLDINEFNRTESILFSGSAGDVYSRRSTLWNYFVEKALVEEQADAIGLGVSRTELLDLQFGPQPSPVIAQRFMNPTTGGVDRTQLDQIKTQIESGTLDPNIRSYWAVQEKEIVKSRLQSKLTNLVSKAIYTPSWMVELNNSAQNQQVDFAYVSVPFSEIPNTEVTVSDQDFKSYIKNNGAALRTDEETRKVTYTVFAVQATAADSVALRTELAELKGDFAAAQNDTLFVEQNQGLMDGTYFTANQLPATIKDTLSNAPAGTVFGPYIQDNTYRLVKVLDRKVIPDSVRARHILLRAQDQLTSMNAFAKIDSIKTVLENGQATWEQMNEQFNQDVAAASEGGDLGYSAPGRMVKPFNDMIFYQAEENEYNIVATQFGIHLVEVTGRKFLNSEESFRLAFLSRNIEPSEETQKARYDEALVFLSEQKSLEDLTQAVSQDPTLQMETSGPLRANDFTVGTLGTGQQSRDIIRWAFGAKVGEVSSDLYVYSDPIGYFDNKIAIVALKNIRKAGLPTVDDVRDEIEPLVVNEKKGELIRQKLQSQDLNAAAAAYGTSVDTARNASFTSAFLPNIGNEPKLIGELATLDQGSVSGPVVGNAGVYVAKVIRKSAAPATTNVPVLRQSMNTTDRSQVTSTLMTAIKNNADIKDNRNAYY